MQIKTLDPATHAYSFWEGVPEDSRRAFGRLFRASKTLQVRLFCSSARGVTGCFDPALLGSRLYFH